MINNVAANKLSHDGKNKFFTLLRQIAILLSNIFPVGDLDKTKDAAQTVTTISNAFASLQFKDRLIDLKVTEVVKSPGQSGGPKL